jgi:hypothetical protein
LRDSWNPYVYLCLFLLTLAQKTTRSCLGASDRDCFDDIFIPRYPRLFRCHLVSRRWRYYALFNPSCYASVDLSFLKNLVTLEEVQSIILNAGGRVKTLKMELPEVTFSPSCFHIFEGEGSNIPGPGFHITHHIQPLFGNLERFELRYSHISVSAEYLFGIPWAQMLSLRLLKLRGYFGATDIARICAAAGHIEGLDCECTLEKDDRYHQWIETSRSVKGVMYWRNM